MIKWLAIGMVFGATVATVAGLFSGILNDGTLAWNQIVTMAILLIILWRQP